MYFRTRKIQRLRHGQPHTPTKIPITIQEAPKKDDEMRVEKGKLQDVTSPLRTPVTYLRIQSARLASATYILTPTNAQKTK